MYVKIKKEWKTILIAFMISLSAIFGWILWHPKPSSFPPTGVTNTFGYSTIGASQTTLAGSSWEHITGSIYTCPQTGTAESITVALKRSTSGSNNAKCAIYRHSDLDLIGSTQEVYCSLTNSFQWFTFNFSFPKPALVPNEVYLLVVWADYTSSNIYIAYGSNDTIDQGHYCTQTYGGSFPDPFPSPTHVASKYSIYCTYTLPLTVSVSASSDDAYETGSGSFYSSFTEVRMASYTDNTSSSYMCGGFRFPNVNIPAYSIILAANLYVYATYGEPYDYPNLIIYGENVSNSQNFVDNPHIISQSYRPRTNANVSWVASLTGTGWKIKTGLGGIVQEIVNRSDWGSGNALTLLLIANTDATHSFYVDSYDTGPSYAAYLEIVYADGQAPSISLNMAGNGQETYTALSRQIRNFCYINATITDNIAVSQSLLSWYNNSWTNYTMMNQAGTSFYYYNITNQPSGIDYTFKIYANDTSNNWATFTWEKPGLYPPVMNNVTKYVRLNYTSSSWQYKAYYYWKFPRASQDVQRALLPHEQLVSTGPNDTGLLLLSRPTETFTVTCSAFIWFWIDENTTLTDTIVDTVYYHVWWTATDVDTAQMYYMKNEEKATSLSGISKKYETDISKSDKTFNDTNQNVTVSGTTYYLSCRFVNDSNQWTINDNDLYELGTALRGAGINYPKILEHPNMTSFIIFNLPDNQTLQQMDSDGDGLSDYDELFVYHTDPFKNDTDNDGANDKWEIDHGFNPLNWDSYFYYPLNLQVKDWDLTDNIQGATVYVNSTSLISDSNGWANFTNLLGYYEVKVSYFGFWVNGTFPVTVNDQKIIIVKCAIYDGQAWIRDCENLTDINNATVKLFNVSWYQIASGYTGSDGKYSFTNLPNASLGLEVWRNETFIYNGSTPVLTEDIIFEKDINITYINATSQWVKKTLLSLDIGHTLGEVNASLRAFNIQFEIFSIEWANGSRSLFFRNETWNADVVLTADAEYIWIWSTTIGLWVHKYV